MNEGRASETAVGAAVRRAIHQLDDIEPKILSDPVIGRLLESASPGAIEAWSETLRFVPAAPFVLRSRVAEDELALVIARGVRQYAILGAGLDTFAFRQPPITGDLRIFEVDHPVTQVWKRNALRTADIHVPTNVTWAPVDFERQTLAEGLADAGFDTRQPSFFSWLGVTQYLSRPAIEQTLNFVASLPNPTTIVLTFVLPDEALFGADLEIAQQSAKITAALGEPWLTRFRPTEIVAWLQSIGFSRVFHLTPEEATRRYFSGRLDGMRALELEQIISATI